MDVEGVLEGVQPYTIHGNPYYQLYFTRSGDPDTILTCQLPAEAFDPTLRPGAPILITYLLQTVMRISPRPTTSLPTT